MTFTPGVRLLQGLVVWTALALVALALPELRPALAAAAGALLVLGGVDLQRLRREPAPRLERILPPRAHVDRESEIRLRIRNPTSRPLRVELFEALPPDLRGPDALAPLETPPLASAEVCVAIRPAERGQRVLGTPVGLVRSPFGLFRRRIEGPPDQRLRVDPDTSRLLRPEALQPDRVLSVLGAKPARPRGDGMEFDSLRDYVPGDDPRRLDWAASARRGRPVVRQFRHERNHTVLLALDASRLMAARVEGRAKLDHAVDAGLALAYAALVAGDRVALTVFDDAVRGHLAPGRGRRDLGRLLEFLVDEQPRLVEPDYEALLRSLERRQRQRALVVVFTDFVEVEATRLVPALSALGRRHRVLLVALRDPIYEEAEAVTSCPPDDPDAPLRRIVIDDLLHDREVALTSLRRRGLQTLDLPPQSCTAPVLNRYLTIRDQV